jgi:NLI interacting factor-like phosphatase
MSGSIVDDKAIRCSIVIDRIISASTHAKHTRSVQVNLPTKRRHNKKQLQGDDPVKHRIVHVTTSCSVPLNVTNDHDSTEVRINVKPLLILDLNGILCHRIRRQMNSADTKLKNNVQHPYRPQLGPDISQTPIIPRPDVSAFLEYLDEHFCLAIWTSAKAKTARKLIELLIPELVRERLLFVWSQSHCCCEATSPQTLESSTPSETVYYKKLSVVWQKYPMWNTLNTLLIDDSPEKCIYCKENALHPPPMHGRQTQHQSEGFDPGIQMSDEENVSKQLDFMQKLVQYWAATNVRQTWDSGMEDDIPVTVHDDTKDIKSFLAQHATAHMGYQQGVYDT